MTNMTNFGRRLTADIENIKIYGSEDELLRLVQNIDREMQVFAQETQDLKKTIIKYNTSNTGPYYADICDAIKEFSGDIYYASEELNYLQKQIVEYYNKCCILALRPGNAVEPRGHSVNIVHLDVNEIILLYTKADMIHVESEMERYAETIKNCSGKLSQIRDDIGNIWKDPQYITFSDYIDEILSMIITGCDKMATYLDHIKWIIIHI